MLVDEKITKIIGGGVRNSGSKTYGKNIVEKRADICTNHFRR